MKIKILLVAAALAALATGIEAQTKTMPHKPPTMGKKTPMRDPKTGKFVKKTMPMRDAKGRFVRTHAKTTKPGPMRDPKTGRFMKKSKP